MLHQDSFNTVCFFRLLCTTDLIVGLIWFTNQGPRKSQMTVGVVFHW